MRRGCGTRKQARLARWPPTGSPAGMYGTHLCALPAPGACVTCTAGALQQSCAAAPPGSTAGAGFRASAPHSAAGTREAGGPGRAGGQGRQGGGLGYWLGEKRRLHRGCGAAQMGRCCCHASCLPRAQQRSQAARGAANKAAPHLLYMKVVRVVQPQRAQLGDVLRSGHSRHSKRVSRSRARHKHHLRCGAALARGHGVLPCTAASAQRTGKAGACSCPGAPTL